ncbi:CAMKK/CAMKK-META protein kinase [Saprolegnia diclina VS20]|uniref:cGMP-dependent protein kinase n=1 Tax=Saprolegnia diclina (strain VS20) TaxID=1156394 RepID=T0RTL7_SAPDV|nr:CAMKK/CAMKK-META protein kinase [Saprolegnia diclina VS20]EQC35853.1 CAMKK/CAMKK-META protein kinase [Saprolegnia diclina VS20]|eukprot:XP_008610615.1 CAMKK/CAMKK-META protein kinase [Saprolegnia diclina VS20]
MGQKGSKAQQKESHASMYQGLAGRMHKRKSQEDGRPAHALSDPIRAPVSAPAFLPRAMTPPPPSASGTPTTPPRMSSDFSTPLATPAPRHSPATSTNSTPLATPAPRSSGGTYVRPHMQSFDRVNRSSSMPVDTSTDEESVGSPASNEVGDWLMEDDDIEIEMVDDDDLNSEHDTEHTEPEVTLTPYLLANKPLYDIMIQVQLFANLSQNQQEQVLQALKPIKFKDGQAIVKQGERGERFFMIAKGEAVITKNMDGKERMITHLYAGHYFGELALIYDDPRTATVRAVGDVELLYLTQKDFQQVGQVHLSLMLQQVPLLAQLTSRDQDAILKKLKPANFSNGDYIVRQGEEGTRFYMITRGEAAVLETHEADGQERELTRLYEGHVFGEMSLIYKEPRTASVVAIGPVKCLYLTKEDFDECLLSERFQKVIQRAYIEKATRRAMRNKNRLQEANKPSSATDMSQMTLEGLNGVALETSKLTKHRLANGEKVVNKYVIKGELGKGTFGTVKKCMNEEDGKLYAVKIMHKTFVQRMANREDSLQDALRREVAIMKKLSHRNVVRLVEVIDDPSSQKVYLVQEYIEKGNLTEIAHGDRLPEYVVRKYMRDLVCGLQYLHFHKIVHRDIKPENILVTADDIAKIADFGAARMVMNEAETISGAKGTPAFMAPEMFNINAEYTGPSADIWSLGATLYMMMFGHPPWLADNEIELAEKVQRDELSFPEGFVEPHLKNLLQRMLTKDPDRRITLADVMNHEWITREGSEPIINNIFEDGINKVTFDETDGAIQNIPERIDQRLQASLAEAHLMLTNKTLLGRRTPNASSMHSLTSSKSSNDNGSPSRQKSFSSARSKRSPLRSKNSNESMGSTLEAARVISAWRHHKRVALMDGHNLSERVRDLLLEQKRMAFSVERAQITEIILPTNHLLPSPTRRNTQGLESTASDEDLLKRQLSRKKDFVMVTSEVFRGEEGDLQSRKVLFQATNQDFSIASRVPLHSSSESSMVDSRTMSDSRNLSESRTLSDHRKMSDSRSIDSRKLSEASRKLSDSRSKLSDSRKNSDTVRTMSGSRKSSRSSTQDKSNHSMNDLLNAETVMSEGSSDEDSDDDDDMRAMSSSSKGSSAYSDVECDVDVNETFEDLLHTPRSGDERNDDIEVAPLECETTTFFPEDEIDVIQVYVSSKIRENLALGLRAGYAEAKGERPYMEDKSLALTHYPRPGNDAETIAYYAVYDGHNGDETALVLQKELHMKILDRLATSSPEDAMLDGCRVMDEELLAKDNAKIAGFTRDGNAARPAPISFSGSAAIMALLLNVEDGLQLVIGHVGDCRAVLCRGPEALSLTVDHKASNAIEKERIEKAGGFVHNGRLDGILAISRAFGDLAHKSDGHLIAVPDITTEMIEPEDEFLLLASDGLFDVITSQQAVNFIRRKLRNHGDVQLAAQELVLKAQEYVSHDNISAIVICFHQT